MTDPPKRTSVTLREIFYADMVTAMRMLWARMMEHPLMTVFFGLITVIAIWLIIFMIHFLETNIPYDSAEPLLTSQSIGILFFLVVLVRMLIYVYRRLLRAEELRMILTMDLDLRALVAGKFLANIFSIMVLIGGGFALVTLMLLTIGVNILEFPNEILVIVPEGLMLFTLASCLGLVLPIFLQIRPRRSGMIPLGAAVVIMSASLMMLRNIPHAEKGALYYSIMASLTLVSLVLVAQAHRFLLEAWNRQLSRPLRLRRKEDSVDRFSLERGLGPVLNRQEMLLTKKEMIILIRERDAIATMATSVFLAISLVVLYQAIGPHSEINSPGAMFIYPFVLGFSLFLGATLQCGLIGLASIGLEGRRLWIMKSLPIPGISVLKGKATTILILALPFVVLIVFPISIVESFPLTLVAFFSIEAVVLVIAFTGIGIYSGAKFPNFDESLRNMPDLMSQFVIISLCGLVACILLGIPAGLMLVRHEVGLIASIVAVGWATVVLIFCLDRGERAFDEIGADRFL